MAIFVFALSLALLVAGLASGYMSLDLLPTSVGVLYALSGAVAVALAVVAFALGVLTRRIDALATLRPLPPQEFAHLLLQDLLQELLHDLTGEFLQSFPRGD